MQEDRQTTEVRESNEQMGATNVQRQTIEKKTDVSGVVIAQRVIYYIGGVIIALLALRVLLQLFGANQNSDFVGFIYGLSGLFAAPFFGMFGEPTFGASHLDSSALVAMIVYALVTVGLAKLITLSRPHEEI
ncbi:MAG: YggT family protein [Candidatus Saccharimonas sp.]